MKLNYPATPTGHVIEDYHGTSVPDPYRWLEDVDSPETLDWIKRQNELTFGWLEQVPGRDQIRERLTGLWDFPKRMTIEHKARTEQGRSDNRYFQFRNTGLQNQDLLYVMNDPTDRGRVLLDPNKLSEDGTAALNVTSISDDGEWLAYAVSRSGSDWQVWHIRAVGTGQDLPEMLEWSKFSGAAWAHDGSGFYYCRYAEPAEGEAYQQTNYDQKLYFHRLNTPQSDDPLVYERPDQPEWGFGAEVTDDGRYLVLAVWQGTDTRNRFFYRDLSGAEEMVELIPDLEAAYDFIGNDGPLFYFRTDLAAPRARLILIDTTQPDKGRWKTLIPESGDVLEAVKLINDQFVEIYLHDAHELVKRFALDGTPLGEISLPTLGSVSYGYVATLAGRRQDKELFYLFHSFAYPITVFRYDFDTDQSEALFAPPIQFDFSPFVTRQVFVPSKDGTMIPMFLVHRQDLQLDGQNPTLLYGYGGFNISLTPAFAIPRVAWLELGGVYAVANLRGGGEYGEDWHHAGMLLAKQNVFDDFIACAEWLIREKITSTPKLAIEGRSNGGLLVGACLTQRPDLFGACIPIVGVMDMLRFHKFTIGWAWVSDYGSSDKLEQFEALYAYSPYHNIKPGTAYPPTLITTGDHDDRVVPGHSFKFAAALQAAQAGAAAVLIRIQTRAGHGMGKPTTVLIRETADMLSFLVRTLGMETPTDAEGPGALFTTISEETPQE
jgi:prolyl oligopeptidase